MARSTSLPPATFLPLLGTMNGSPASACSEPAGIFGEDVIVNSLMPVSSKPSLVLDFISFSIQPPVG